MNSALRGAMLIAVAIVTAFHPAAAQSTVALASAEVAASTQSLKDQNRQKGAGDTVASALPAIEVPAGSAVLTPVRPMPATVQAQLPVLPLPPEPGLTEVQPPAAEPLPMIAVPPTMAVPPSSAVSPGSAVSPSPAVSPGSAVPPTLQPSRLEPAPALPHSAALTAGSYRVIVQASTPEAQQRVRTLVPGAFRTTVNGQSVMQAGLFRSQTTAEEMQRSLSRQNLQATVIPAAEMSEQPPSDRLMYRVIVQASTPEAQQRVRTLVPGAFQTTVNNQTVMQAGLFRSQTTADELQRSLSRQNLQATVMPIAETAVPPRPAPNERHVVMIDPGHGGRDPGAVGIGGLREKDITLSISQQVANLLAQEGVQAVLTRSVDRELELATRVQMAERADANLFVSIHANAISMSRPDINGVETYYYDTGRSLAQAIHSSVLQSVDMNDRGVRQARFYVLRNTTMPSALVEVGFVTGREDAAHLRNSNFLTRMAGAIASGILDHVRSR